MLGSKRYLQGFVELKVEGVVPEKLINLAYLNGIEFWDVRQKKGSLSFCLLVRDFKRLRPLARAARCRVRIRRRRGLPFFLRRVKGRKILLAGVFAFLGLLIYLSTFIWFVEVAGLKNVPREKVLAQARQLGLSPGVRRPSLRLEEIERGLLDSLPELSWVKINLHGTVALIDAAERSLPPPLETPGPCEVVAARDGLVLSVLVLSGQAVVRPGETVKQGQVLISGMLGGNGSPSAGQNPTPVREVDARGIVRARVWYQEYAEIPLDQVVRIRTGRSQEREVLRFGDQEIIWKGGGPVPFALYEEERKPSLTWQWRKSSFSVESVRVIYYELQEKHVLLTAEEAKAKARQMALDRILAQLPPGAERTEVRAAVLSLPQAVGVTVTVETIEDIGVRRPLKGAEK